MEEEMSGSCSWFEDELVRELLDDETPLFVLPEETATASETKSCSSNVEAAFVNSLAFSSGPTIDDFEDALSVKTHKDQFSQAFSQARISLLEGGLSKIENKYTLKIKSCGGNGMADDGYKWRKYGQKSIKNSPNPRSYYKCTNSRCSAKKQVERSCEDPDTLVITYEGLHLHFAYPYFLLNRAQPVQSLSLKKPRKATFSQAAAAAAVEELEFQQGPSNRDSTGAQRKPRTSDSEDSLPVESAVEAPSPQGLLEDMVPLMIRNPNVSSNTSSSSSYRSPPTSPSSLSWSPNYTYAPSCFDLGLIN